MRSAILARGGRLAASALLLLFLSHAPPLRAQSYLNLNFGSGTKTGVAATGSGTNDLWNIIPAATNVASTYTYSSGNPTVATITWGTTTNLVWADNSASMVSVTITNLTTLYHNGSSDAMFDSYLGSAKVLVSDYNPFTFQQITSNANPRVVITNLPASTYEFYIYGSGASQGDNEGYSIQIGTNAATAVQWTTRPYALSTNWQQDTQYVKFTNQVVAANETVTISLSGNGQNHHLINGLQIVNLILPPPAVRLTSPATNSPFMSLATVLLTAEATNNNGTVASVTFFQGTNQLATVTNMPYTFTWNNVVAGTYTVTALATDTRGTNAVSAPLTITVDPYYLLTDLGLAYVSGLNNFGQVIGNSTSTNGPGAFLWTPDAVNGASGSAISLLNLLDATNSWRRYGGAQALNNAGSLAGGFEDDYMDTPNNIYPIYRAVALWKHLPGEAWSHLGTNTAEYYGTFYEDYFRTNYWERGSTNYVAAWLTPGREREYINVQLMGVQATAMNDANAVVLNYWDQSTYPPRQYTVLKDGSTRYHAGNFGNIGSFNYNTNRTIYTNYPGQQSLRYNPDVDHINVVTNPANVQTFGYGINSYGQVVGRSGVLATNNPSLMSIWGFAPYHRAFLWSSNYGMADLGTLISTNSTSTNEFSEARGINRYGQVVGLSSTTSGKNHGFRWVPSVNNGTNGTMVDLGTLPGYETSEVNAINSNPLLFQMVGTSSTNNGGVTDRRAFIYDDQHGLRDLNQLILAAPGWHLGEAKAINDSGQILVHAHDEAGGLIRAYLLSPAPNSAITAILTSPTNYAEFHLPAVGVLTNLLLTATASSTKGVITNVSFYNGLGFDNLIGTVTSGTNDSYRLIWNNVGAGVYNLTGLAADNMGGIAYLKPITLVVHPPTNRPPVVTAGTNQTITLPAAANLSGSVTDDGLPSGYLLSTWSLVSGPGTVTVGDLNAPATTASFSVAGVYVLRLTATDNQLTASADVTITVNPPVPILSVVLTSPTNNSVFQAVANITLTAAATDINGTVTGVSLYQGTNLLGAFTNATCTLQWTNVRAVRT